MFKRFFYTKLCLLPQGPFQISPEKVLKRRTSEPTVNRKGKGKGLSRVFGANVKSKEGA